MKKVFRYDRKQKTLILQSVIMLVIAFGSFYAYYFTRQTIYLVLFAFAMAFIGIYFYRIFFMRVVFEDDKVTFKGILRRCIIAKSDVFDIQIIKQMGREVYAVKFDENMDSSILQTKCYALIRKNPDVLQKNLSMFNAADDNYISLEYRPTLKTELEKIAKQKSK